MTLRTKQDVFEEAVTMIELLVKDGAEYAEASRKSFAEALPDDMPTLPQAAGDVIRKAKTTSQSLGKAMVDAGKWLEEYYTFNEKVVKQDAFARAWLYESWIAEETGEVERV